ncbi:MAG: putative Ribokinase [Parcubacteria group bacterium Gr01-1014_44]|nr:MAG: putative Ribokinase [Parcubacteria group bacterium Gr01-1014_44]
MFNKKYDIVSIGSATRDVFLKSADFELRKHTDSPTGLEQCFSLGSKIEIKEMVFTTGGGGTNAAVTFARQGLKTANIGVVGRDFNGRAILEELKKEGVETKFFQIHDDDFTAYSIILSHSSGERTILSYKGEGQHFAVKMVPFEKIKTAWFFLDSLGGHYDLLEAVFNYADPEPSPSASYGAGKNKIKIAFNPGGKELAHGLEKLRPFLGKTDILMANKEELAQLTGIASNQTGEILNRLKEITPGIVVVTDGPHGVIVKDAEGKEYSAGVPDSPVVERTGAGDAFGSGFVSEYIKSGDIVKAIQFGTANASSVVTQFGSKAGILKKGDWGPWPLVNVSVG